MVSETRLTDNHSQSLAATAAASQPLTAASQPLTGHVTCQWQLLPAS